MRRISYIIMSLMLAIAAQSCETELDTDVDNVTDAVEGNYKVLRTIELFDCSNAGSLASFQFSIDYVDPVSIAVEGATTIRIDGIRCEDLAAIKNGVWFSIPSQVAKGNRIVGAASLYNGSESTWSGNEYSMVLSENPPLDVDEQSVDCFYSAPTQTITMIYYVNPSDFTDDLENIGGYKEDKYGISEVKKEELLNYLEVSDFYEISSNSVFASKAKVIRIRDLMRKVIK